MWIYSKFKFPATCSLHFFYNDVSLPHFCDFLLRNFGEWWYLSSSSPGGGRTTGGANFYSLPLSNTIYRCLDAYLRHWSIKTTTMVTFLLEKRKISNFDMILSFEWIRRIPISPLCYYDVYTPPLWFFLKSMNYKNWYLTKTS